MHRQDAELFADGTFSTCVNLEQLYIMHACINGHYMPVVFCLLTGQDLSSSWDGRPWPQ